MGQIVANFFISLDGVVERPDQWHFPYFNDEMGETIGAGMKTYDAFLMGRTMYDEWSQYWPQQSADEPFATFINEIPKYVVSNSLTEATWSNTTIIPGATAAEELRALKSSLPRDIGMSGSTTLVRWLLAEKLLDRLELLIHPIVVGHGERLFTDGETYPLTLTQQKTLKTGVLHTTYTPAAA
ncbi:hypothetical protein BTM25_49870 [Actinomadura rubteroloni]|uniref:Bacterial bifunctional deaminase-reductase C-terminal domain-containing protein n=1 Tax=Actinomadura rubteroloni TaxID=1926885 RepID=A0A2P4UCK4_9ACTN|nr:dihydrofolate reductase family protein [Actinomadura rubteroloni]POM22783.1 hypothetical protein BTM25_49870 [Actinomadura rubteroloni]